MTANINTNLYNMVIHFGSHDKWINKFNKGYAWGDDIKCINFLNRAINNRFGKVSNLLEIATGYGRLTNVLLKNNYCDNLYGIDLNGCCVDYCIENFPQGFFKRCDGLSIPFQDILFDVVISYDSMVHFDSDIIEIYLQEIYKVTTDSAYVILHHGASGETGKGMRSNMTSDKMVNLAQKYDYKIIDQFFFWKLVDGSFNDCVTVLQK